MSIRTKPGSVDKMSESDWAEARRHAEKWVQVGTCTEPANRDEVEKVVTEFYKGVGQDAPDFFWFDGPLQACMEGPKRIGFDNTMENARKVFRLREWGAEFAWWVGWHRILQEVVGVEYTKEQEGILDQWERLVRSGGWWFAAEGCVFACERHRIVSFDERGLLHSETGPSIECRDGFSVYAWHGTVVPEKWITDRTNLDPKTALTWENIEQRRAAAEIIGWDKVIKGLKPKQLHKDKFGVLLEVDLPDSPKEKFVRVACATGRTFVLPCDPQAKTALQAVAASYGVAPEVYKKLQHRT